MTNQPKVIVTISGKQYTGRSLGAIDSKGTLRVRLDELAVINPWPAQWRQTVPEGQPIRTVTVPREWVQER